MLVIEKIIASFLSPPGLFILVWSIITLHILYKTRGKGIKVLTLATLLLMYIIFSGIGTYLFLLPLENRYLEKNINELDRPYPVVVLGGGINYLNEKRAELNQWSLQRLFIGYKLQKRLDVPIIYTGGVAIGHKEISESYIAREWLIEMGVPVYKIIDEKRARTTYENALYVKRLFKEREIDRLYLVTSALHLPRAMAVFFKQGLNPIPVPAGYMASHNLSWLDLLPNRSSLTANLAAIHEWVGLLWYKIQGRI